MANWTHRYRQEQIPPAGAIGGVITAHRPGRQIADAITELQDRVVTDIEVQGDGIEDTGSSIVDNTLRLRLRVDAPDPTPPGDVLPSGGDPGMVLTRTSSGYEWDWVRAVEI
jgi:hypothetical protein